MSIKNEEDKLFESLRKKHPKIIDDGVVNEEEYLKAKWKIMFVLKEVNNVEKDFSLRNYLKDDGRSQTWNNIARWSEGIYKLPEEKSWDYWKSDNENRRKYILQKICAINLKKTSGGHTSNNKIIYQAALDLDNKKLLLKQIEFI